MSHKMSRDAMYASSLLGYTKGAVKNIAAAITETATPQVREVLVSHLQQAISMHQAVFEYMHSHHLYPAYDVERSVLHAQKTAQTALSMPITSMRDGGVQQ